MADGVDCALSVCFAAIKLNMGTMLCVDCSPTRCHRDCPELPCKTTPREPATRCPTWPPACLQMILSSHSSLPDLAHKSNQVIGWVLKVLKPLIVGLYLLRLYRYKYFACLCLMTEHASASWSRGIPSHVTLVTLVTPVNPYFGGVNWNQHEITWTPVRHVPTEQRASLGRARLIERAIA